MPAVPDASSAPRSASAEAASRASVAVRWAVGVGAATMTAIGLVLLFLLTLATNNRALYERNYAWLFGVNVLVAALLLGVLVWQADAVLRYANATAVGLHDPKDYIGTVVSTKPVPPPAAKADEGLPP